MVMILSSFFSYKVLNREYCQCCCHAHRKIDKLDSWVSSGVQLETTTKLFPPYSAWCLRMPLMVWQQPWQPRCRWWWCLMLDWTGIWLLVPHKFSILWRSSILRCLVFLAMSDRNKKYKYVGLDDLGELRNLGGKAGVWIIVIKLDIDLLQPLHYGPGYHQLTTL